MLALFPSILAGTTSFAGKNVGGALIVHTDDNVSYTYTGQYCGAQFSDPGTCEAAVMTTNKDENTPALIWLLAAFPDTSNPAVSVIYFGIEHNLGEGSFVNHGYCAPAGTLEIPDSGWPDTGFGNSVAFGTPVQGDILFPFYWFAAYGTEGSYLTTRTNPIGGYAAFVDDSNPPVEDRVTRFGTVRWYAEGSNDCPAGGGGDDGPSGPGGEDEWLDGDGERQWVRDCILVQLREDLPMPPRQPVEDLGIPDFDALGSQLGLVSARRLLMLNDETCLRYPGINRMVVLRFGPGTDEVEAARRYAQLSEVAAAQPNYAASAVRLSAYANDPGFTRQWHLLGPGAASCRDDDLNPECCLGCDIGVDVAWQYTRGDSAVRVAFIDDGADMQHPDLLDAYAFNPREDANGNGRPDLCPADPDSGDIDFFDADSNGVEDDVLLGWALVGGLSTWNHRPRYHGTAVAGLLGSITNNGTGTASAAGGDEDSLHVPGIRLIQFSLRDTLTSEFQIQTFVYAREYRARVYTSSLGNLLDDALVEAAVDSLSDEMLFLQAVGNEANTDIIPFALLPSVLAVGGYDGITGGRWVTDKYEEGPLGSNYGPKLELLGPAADERVRPI